MSRAVALEQLEVVRSLEEEADQSELLPSAHHLVGPLAEGAGHAECQVEKATG